MFFPLLVTVCCVFTCACFSGFENGMIAVRRARLDHAVANGVKSAILMERLLSRPAVLLGTILLGTNLAHSFAAVYFDEFLKAFPPSIALTVGGATGLTIIILIFGEITPKIWFRQRPFSRCQMMIYPIYVFHWLFAPFTRLLGLLSRLLSRWSAGQRAHHDASVMRDDFRIMLLESVEHDVIDREAGQLLERALDFRETRVSDIMTPADRVVALASDATLADAVRLAETEGLSRFPVARPGSEKHWLGVLSVYDAIFRVPPADWEKVRVVAHLRPVATIRDTAVIDHVLPRLRLSAAPLLFVVDDDGRQRGVVSPSDVVSRLFGEVSI